jgi:hypothetical protein
MDMMEKEKDPFDEAIEEDANSREDEWLDDEGEAPAAPSVAVVVAPEAKAEKSAAEPASAEAAPAAASEPVADEPVANEPPAESAAEPEEKSGPTFDEAVAQLKTDFGEEFVGFIHAIAEHAAERVAKKIGEDSAGSMGQRIDALIDDIMRARHRDAIMSAHSDVEEVANSPEFQQFIDGMDEAAKAEASRIIDSGSAKEVVKLLGEFKASKAVSAEEDEFELDAAMAVKGSPSAPSNLSGESPDDYGDDEDWNTDTDTQFMRRK